MSVEHRDLAAGRWFDLSTAASLQEDFDACAVAARRR